MAFDGTELRRRREAAKLSRPAVIACFIRADEQISVATLGRWEDGEGQPRADHLALLAQILDCEVTDFFTHQAKAVSA